jgi:hypothetical protein
LRLCQGSFFEKLSNMKIVKWELGVRWWGFRVLGFYGFEVLVEFPHFPIP